MVNYPTHKNCSKKSSRPNPLTSHIPQSQIQISKETIVPGKQKIHKLLLIHEQLFRATNICRIISFANSSLHPMASARDLAKRALVALIKFLAGIYSLTVDVKRESPDEEVRKAYRTLSRKVHPDKGGQKGEQEKLNAAYEEWCATLKGAAPAGRPKKGEARTAAERPAQLWTPTKRSADRLTV